MIAKQADWQHTDIYQMVKRVHSWTNVHLIAKQVSNGLWFPFLIFSVKTFILSLKSIFSNEFAHNPYAQSKVVQYFLQIILMQNTLLHEIKGVIKLRN